MFGMGTGVTLPLWPPDSIYKWDCKIDEEMKSCIEVLHNGFRLDLIRKGTDG